MREGTIFKQFTRIVLILFMGVIFIIIYISMLGFSVSSNEMRAQNITALIKQATMQCYALEGYYPSNIEYLEEYYGVILDKDKYIFFYDINPISKNMPDITVVPK